MTIISDKIREMVENQMPKTEEINGKIYSVIREPLPYHVVYFKPFLNSETYKVGDFYKVEIIEGQYWGTHGLSNFWYWYRLNEDGYRDIKECGYGAFYSLD